MIASVNPLASATGLQVLRRGGTAVDAAVAAGAVLTVVEPLAGQLGGDAFLLLASPQRGTLTAINGSGAAPLGADAGRFRALGDIPTSGWLAATVPGVVDAWRVALELAGTIPLGELLQDAITYADQGFPISGRLADGIRDMADVALAETLAVFQPEGRLPVPGSRLRQPQLARTLRALQLEGPQAFYHGRIAGAIVAASERGGGLFSAADFARHRTEVLDPIRTTYRGWTVLEQPPVSQGLVVLMALNVLEATAGPDDPADAVERIHLQVEAHKQALAERLRQLGDPAFSPADVAALLSKPYAQRLARRLDRRRALPLGRIAAGAGDTTYLCVVDEAHNVASYIHSLYGSGGNGVVAGDTGVLLNNRMRCFTLEAQSPNQLAPGKRPMHTLNSWILLKEGIPQFVGGTPGSFWQVQTNLQLISSLIDEGLSPQAAVDAPRWAMGPSTAWNDDSLRLEMRFGQQVAAGLQARGHQAQLIGDWAAGGAAQLIRMDGSQLIGAGDPRPGTSCVIGY
jgi:gamma-glutamyltranspeptidase / glutathione hydrolase